MSELNTAMTGLNVGPEGSLASNMKELKSFLKGRSSFEVLRHFCNGDEISNAPHPELLNRVKLIALDEEWWQYEHLNDQITELGLVIVKGSDVKDNALDVTKTLLNAETYHFRPIENCHMINHELNPNSERHALYAHTRFAKIQEIKTKFLEILDSEDPVILVGQSMTQNDLVKLKAQWGIDVAKIDSVVHVIDSVTQIAKKSGIHDRVQAEAEKPGSLTTLIKAFGIRPSWIHNAVNDAMHTLLPILLLGLYPDFYPNDPNDYPKDSSILKDPHLDQDTRLSLDQLLMEVAAHQKTKSPPAIGFAVYCYYCDATDHDAWKCKDKNKLPPCYNCANAPGSANEEFRRKAKSHRTHRCAYEHLHVIPPFSDELKERLDLSELRALSRAAFARDWATYGYLMWKGTGAGRIGDKEVAQWEKDGLLSSDDMIPGYETDTEWLNELDEKAKKSALKKFKKVANPPFSDFHPNASSSQPLGKGV